MTLLPTDLTSRLAEIYTPQELEALGQVFALKKRSTTFRCNTLKTSPQEIKQSLTEAGIHYQLLDFPHNCFLLDPKQSEKDLWNLDIYKEGKIYLQGISSQIPVHFFTPSHEKLHILDACAAPGGKTSQLAELFPHASIYAFEPNSIRYKKLVYNLEKLGASHVKCIQDSVENISRYIDSENFFDRILIDAPCSGEGGLSYHNSKFIESWSLSHIKRNYKRQKSISQALIPYLAESGELIYSTCTLAPEENEAVVHNILCHNPDLRLTKLDLKENIHIKQSKALKNFGQHPFKKEVAENCIRVIPSTSAEGFFISKFKKCQK